MKSPRAVEMPGFDIAIVYIPKIFKSCSDRNSQQTACIEPAEVQKAGSFTDASN
jgi:hypothetical protein